MTHRPDVACSRELAARWCALAERRLDHLSELFQSGRWRRYYTEQSLIEDIRHAKAAVATWKSLSAEPQPVMPERAMPNLARPNPVRPEVVSIVPSPAPSMIMAAAPVVARHVEPEPALQRPIELPRTLEAILSESEIIVDSEIEVVGFDLAEDLPEDGLDGGPEGYFEDRLEDDLEPDYPTDEEVEPELTVAPARIDMAALEQALSIGMDSGADDEDPVVDLDAIERRYPALAVAY
ncbi:TIGR03809 family protein [Bradyrhizobium sp. HKCCYLS3077]|uniref:TIGR03809 family protein n=1 Tax=unclassified Bradyrhizobium TaxID=2631580 RepID=UPI003EB7F10A